MHRSIALDEHYRLHRFIGNQELVQEERGMKETAMAERIEKSPYSQTPRLGIAQSSSAVSAH